MMHLLVHLGLLLTCLYAKFITQVLLASMQISLWGDSFLMRSRFSFSFFLFFPSSRLSSSRSGHFPPPFPVAAGLGLGSFIAKVGGSSMWKEFKRTFEIRAERLMSELLTLLWEFAFLQSFSQSWKRELTTKRFFAGIFLLVCSLALNVDLLFSIILNRALRDWDPMMRSPKKTSFATVNICTCSFISLKFIGALTSCLFDALILSSIRPLPWVRTSWRVSWRFLCSAALIGLTSEKAKGKWLLGVLPLDQRKDPAYMFAVYPIVKLTSFIPLVLNCCLSSCSMRATDLLFMKRLQESVTSSGTSSLSMAEVNKIILMVASWRF